MKRMFMIVSLMFIFVLSACGDNNTENTGEENDEQANKVEESEEQSNDIEEKLDKADENQTSEKEEETFSEAGILKEQIASDMIEVETDEGVTEFKLTKEAQEDVDYVDVGDEVQFTYYEEDEESIIGFIEKSKYYDKPRPHHEHHKHERHHRHQDHHKNRGHHKDRGHHHGQRSND